MDESELVVGTRIAARISNTHPNYTDARIRQELTDALRTVFQEPIKRAGNGYGQQLLEVPIFQGLDVYRIPPRSLVGGLVTVEVKDQAGLVRQMVELNQRDHAELIQLPNEPSGFVDNADFLRLGPSPSVGGFFLRMWYKLRASVIVEKQLNAGIITNVDTVTRIVTVNSLPFDRSDGSPISSADKLDVIAPDGSHELHLVSSPATVAGVNITLPVGTDMTRIQLGDFVRKEDEAEFPTMLPPEFHRTLSDAAAVVILSDMGTTDKAAALATKVKADVDRMIEMLEPRVRDIAKPFIPKFGPLRAFRRWTPPSRL